MRRRGFYYFPGQTTGRPRARWYVSDYAGGTIDANELRRDAKDAGRGIATPPAIRLTWLDRQGKEWSVRIEVEAQPHPVYGFRWWLRCPRCGARRAKLQVPRSGPGCRGCLQILYARR